MSIIPILKEGLGSLDIAVSASQLEMLETYCRRLIEYNQKVNLTAITEPEEIAKKHFLDCAACQYLIRSGSSCADIGTGAGFPGLVLKIFRPDIKLTLLDGLNMRLVFLNEVATGLGLTDVETVHLRAEEAGRKQNFRENFDLVTARAVAKQNLLYEYCLPLCKIGGIFCAMKGPSAEEESKEAINAGKLLGGAKPKILTETLTGEEVRTFIITKKISQTPPKYPRVSAKISKQPL